MREAEAVTKLDTGELGNAINQPGDLAPEMGLDVIERRHGVLHRVVKQASADGRTVQLELGQDARNFNRM